MSPLNLTLMLTAAGIFVTASAGAKIYVEAPSWWRLAIVLALYTIGNLIVIRVLREVGLSRVMSLSTVLQLIIVNMLAVLVFRERLAGTHYVGMGLGVLAVILMMWPNRDSTQ
jgi:glucose uptake protein